MPYQLIRSRPLNAHCLASLALAQGYFYGGKGSCQTSRLKVRVFMRATVQLVEFQVRHTHAETLRCGKVAGFMIGLRFVQPISKLHPHRLLALSLDLFFLPWDGFLSILCHCCCKKYRDTCMEETSAASARKKTDRLLVMRFKRPAHTYFL